MNLKPIKEWIDNFDFEDLFINHPVLFSIGAILALLVIAPPIIMLLIMWYKAVFSFFGPLIK